MIQLLEERLKSSTDLGKIHDPPDRPLHLPADIDLDAEGMAMQSAAFMAFRQMGQKVRRLERKLLEDLHPYQCLGRAVSAKRRPFLRFQSPPPYTPDITRRSAARSGRVCPDPRRHGRAR